MTTNNSNMKLYYETPRNTKVEHKVQHIIIVN